MSVQEDERLWKWYVGQVYYFLHDENSLAAAKKEFPFPELSDEDREAAYSEAAAKIEELKAYLRKDANQWFWWGLAILAAIVVITATMGAPESSRNLGRLWWGIIIALGFFGYGAYCKIWPLR
jgi:hypothetical protein